MHSLDVRELDLSMWKSTSVAWKAYIQQVRCADWSFTELFQDSVAPSCAKQAATVAKAEQLIMAQHVPLISDLSRLLKLPLAVPLKLF